MTSNDLDETILREFFSEDDLEEDKNIAAFLLDLLFSDDEETSKWGGSRPGKAPNKDREFDVAYQRLLHDYFSGPSSKYSEADFERRFRVNRTVFDQLAGAVYGKGRFKMRYDCTGKHGIHPLCRITAVLRAICYGDPFDREDEYLQISETSVDDSVKEFTRLVTEAFRGEWLNYNPSEEEKARAVCINTDRGFPGMLYSWDCKHFVWHNCPVRYAGQYKGHALGGAKTIILECIADADGKCPYLYFGPPGSMNDINVLDRSSIVGAILRGEFDLRAEPYEINGTMRDWYYFLVDGIYPDWAIFVKTILNAMGAKYVLFANTQEFVRKDVERFFGVFLKQFQMLQHPL